MNEQAKGSDKSGCICDDGFGMNLSCPVHRSPPVEPEAKETVWKADSGLPEALADSVAAVLQNALERAEEALRFSLGYLIMPADVEARMACEKVRFTIPLVEKALRKLLSSQGSSSLAGGVASQDYSLAEGEGEWTEQRVYDLLRYCRSELHEAHLITNEEYASLASTGSVSARRLEDYEALRQRLSLAERERDEAREVIGQAISIAAFMPTGNDACCAKCGDPVEIDGRDWEDGDICWRCSNEVLNFVIIKLQSISASLPNSVAAKIQEEKEA